MKYYLTIFILCLSVKGFSQNLEIFNSHRTVNIQAADYLEVGVKISSKNNCCGVVEFEGHLTSIEKDSLSFNFSKMNYSLELSTKDKKLNRQYLDDFPDKKIAISDIIYLNDYKSAKNKNVRTNLMGIGGLVMAGGALTTINALIFAKGNKKNLLLAGGLQAGVGFIISISANKSRKQFKKNIDPWKFN